MKIFIAQINTTIGDFDRNSDKMVEALHEAEHKGADICVFPEMAVCGYPPRDLLEKPSFIEGAMRALDLVAVETKGCAAVVGSIAQNENEMGRPLCNSAYILHNGEVAFVQHKTLLPEYDVFDEARYFEPAKESLTYDIAGKAVGLSLCEDIWDEQEYVGHRLYGRDPISDLRSQGAELIINISASPYSIDKHAVRRQLVARAAARSNVPVIYCNAVGGNDELVFDGRSLVAIPGRGIVRELKGFAEDFSLVDLDVDIDDPAVALDQMEDLKRALILGLSDYTAKCGFKRAVIGLSGGIDSALVAAIAADALGAENILGVMMPSPFSSKGSVDDAVALAKNLGIESKLIPIGEIYDSYRSTLGFGGAIVDVSLAEENIQARIRGNILMALSNSHRSLVLSTGNKSELSVGYCTLYGDMAGGLALISDLPKTLVYALARHINSEHEIIPNVIIDKPPSAELKPGQRDDDSLPPYDILDVIMKLYVEERFSVDAIEAQGFDRDIVERVVMLIDRNEYKRRQGAPGIKVTSKAFGIGRRMPIAWRP